MYINTLIILVTFNSEKFIEKCLNSILFSDYKNWFLILIDNNSKDSTLSKIRNYIENSRELKGTNFGLINLDKNIGFSSAVNYAVFHIIMKEKPDLYKNIEYLILINPDLRLDSRALGNLILPFNQNEFNHNKIGAAGGMILEYEGNKIQHFGGGFSDNFITYHLEQGKEFKKDNLGSKSGQTRNLKEVNYVTGALFSTKFSIFKDMGGFDSGYRPVYFEELDYCLKLKKLGMKIVVNPLSVSRHFEGASIEKFSANFYKYYHKNRVRCGLINYSIRNFFRLFLTRELEWLKHDATKEQYSALAYAYFLNFLFLPYNLLVKLKNYLIIKKLSLKYNKFN